jgi:subtilisin family serine protease
MRLLISILVLISFHAHGEIRSVFKGAKASVLNRPLKQMTFGLSARQIERISALSGLQFGDVYYIDHADDLSFSSTPGFSGVILPGVPPPAEQSQKAGDPELRNEWWIEKLGVHEAWPMATGQGVVIADCDAGFYHDEPDLHDNMLLDLKADLSDRDEPNVVDDGPFATHGTSVTAIIAGVMNGLGTNGIAYNAKIVPLQNFNYDDTDDLDKEEATAACILKAITIPEVKIVVLENQTSNGSSETFVGTRDAVRLALQAGVIIVSAGGNYSAELLEEKKDNTGSIIVGALQEDDTVPYWSNFGERVTVAAYGEKLHTLSGPNGVFADFGGTSGATPQVAAAVALMKEVNPLMTPEQTRQLLLQTRRTTPATEKVGGILRVADAVTAARNAPADVAAWTRQSLFREQLRSILLNP